MQKVVSISLNGNSYQLEEPGFNLLSSYLERADSRLKDSPDRAEVMADLEQAIGEKCRGMLGPHKTVVSVAEVERIIAEMGPVESADEKTASDAAAGACAAWGRRWVPCCLCLRHPQRQRRRRRRSRSSHPRIPPGPSLR